MGVTNELRKPTGQVIFLHTHTYTQTNTATTEHINMQFSRLGICKKPKGRCQTTNKKDSKTNAKNQPEENGFSSAEAKNR